MKKAVAALLMVLALPVAVMASGGARSDACPIGVGPTGDGLSILGPSTATVEDLTAFWDARKGGQPSRLNAPIADVIGAYITAGNAEGVRGDVAFVQSLIETGWFTNTDTSRNNYAGVGHYDNAPAGFDFPSPSAGVTGQIQLLKRYAAGNDVDLALVDYAPNAGASSSTWQGLSGTWASDTTYGGKIVDQYGQLLAAAGLPAAAAGTCPEGPEIVASGDLATVGGITVAVEVAPQTQAMLAAAAGDGVTLAGSGYRDPGRQIELRRAHCGSSQYAIYEAPSSSCSPPTARPGSSLHEQGLAIDFRNCSSRGTACYRWLAANAARFGFANLPSEAWHWSTGPKAGS